MAGKPKVAKAKDRHGDPVYRRMLQQQPRPFTPPLTCFGCSRPASIVEPHVRSGHRVSAHLRLYEGHDAGCELNPARVIEGIARGSRGLATVGSDGTLRLTVPAQEAPYQRPANEPLTADSPEGEEEAAVRITTVQPWLPPALNSAARVVQFLRRCDFDSEIAEMFTLSHRRRRVAWANFCYGPDEASYARLHQRLAGLGGRLKHPVAVHGTVLRTGMAGRTPFAVLAADLAPLTGSRNLEVVLRSAYPSLLEELQAGMQLLAVGEGWKIFPQDRRNVDEVQLWATEHWHLAYWSWDEETEQADPPQCPRPLSPAERRAADDRRGRSSAGGGQRRARRGPRPVPGRRSPPRTSRPASPGDGASPPPRRAPEPPRPSPVPKRDPRRSPDGEPDIPPGPEPRPADLARLTLESYARPRTPTAKEAPGTAADSVEEKAVTPDPREEQTVTPGAATDPVEEQAVSAEARTSAPPATGAAEPLQVPPRPAYPPSPPVPTPPPVPPEQPAAGPVPAAQRPALRRSGLRGLLQRWRKAP